MLVEPFPSRYDLNLRIAGIPVRIHPYFWLMVLLLGWDDDFALADLLAWTFALVLSILVHEFGHALVTRRFGARDVRVVLHGMGGLTISHASLQHRQRLIQLACGPLAGFILYILVRAIPSIIEIQTRAPILASTLWYLEQINLYWNLLNLLPILPLDGGQIVQELIRQRRPWDGWMLSLKISGVTAIACIVAFTMRAIFAARAEGWGVWFPVFVFAALALLNYQMYQGRYLPGDQEENSRNQQAWERDPDWWKN